MSNLSRDMIGLSRQMIADMANGPLRCIATPAKSHLNGVALAIVEHAERVAELEEACRQKSRRETSVCTDHSKRGHL